MNKPPVVVLFYKSKEDLRGKLTGRSFVENLAGDPWYTDVGVYRVLFMVLPSLEEVPGVLLQLRGFNVVQVFINNENPQIDAKHMSGAFEIAQRLKLETPSLFNNFRLEN